MAADSLSYLLGTSSAPVTVTATANGAALSLPKAGSPRRGYRLRAIINNVTGTSPTLTLKVQYSRDGGTNYLDATTFPNPNSATTNAITAACETYALLEVNESTGAGASSPIKVRVVSTVTGTTPSFDVEVAVVASYPG